MFLPPVSLTPPPHTHALCHVNKIWQDEYLRYFLRSRRAPEGKSDVPLYPSEETGMTNLCNSCWEFTSLSIHIGQ